MRRIRSVVAACLSAASAALAGPVFRVSFDQSVRDQPATGRLIVYLVREGSGNSDAPAEGPFWEDPQPLYGIDVTNLAPGAAATVDDSATSFPVKLSALPKGEYRIQAVLDMARDDSSWKREPGNLYSDVRKATLDPAADDTITIALTHARPQETPRALPGIAYVEIPSKLLSEFHHRPVSLRAGVVLPVGYDPSADRRYPAVYEVPGFGGNHSGVDQQVALRRRAPPESPAGRLARECFWIVLDPESGNGHTLFADSANNGPCAQALIQELIPAIESRFRLIPQASARLLRGHSSGGWSTLWLALNYPETFGATWSTSPDPVDFRRFQLPNIYHDGQMYTRPTVQSGPALSDTPGTPVQSTAPTPSYRINGKPAMTIEQENLMEEVLGPDNTSGQQWDSWMAVFGPRNERGHPAALYDPRTGAIDAMVARQYRKYDIDALLQEHPERYLPLFRNNVRMVVGDQDSFYLNEAVALLKADVDELNAKAGQVPGWGSIKVLPGLDHGTVMMSPELQSIPAQMIERLAQSGHIQPTAR